MQRIRFLGLVLGVWLAFPVCSRADVVTQPLRKFGLGDLSQVAISPDRQWMATSGSSGAFLWNFTNGTVVHRLEAHHTRVGALCFSPDSQVLLTGGLDRTIRAWNVVTGTELRSCTGHLSEISDLAFAPDGQSFVSAGDNSARVWSLATGALLHSVTVPDGGMIRARFAPDGNRLVTADLALSTNNVRLWDLATEQMIRGFDHRSVAVGFIAGDQLVTAGEDSVVRVWDVETGQVLRPLAGASPSIMGLVMSTNSSLVLAGCFNGQVITWDATTGDVEHQFFHEKLISLVAIPGTNQILCGHPEKLVRVKNREIGDNLRVFAGHTTSTTLGVGFSPDGRYVVSGGTEPLTRLWNRTNAQAHFVLPGHGAGTETATFSPDGTRILTTFGAPVFSAQLWDVQTGVVGREFFGHTGWLLAAVFSPDGQRIATGAQDGTARLWDVATGAHIRTFSSPGTWVRAVAVSSNGTFLASGSSDGVARLWDARTGAELRVFSGHAGPVDSVAFNATGTSILTGSDIVRLWSIADIAARLESERKPNNLELRWHTGTLQHSTQVNGPWNDVTNAVSPWIAPTDQPSAFFRARVSAED